MLVWRRIVFFVPAVIYGGITGLRNLLYNRRWFLKSQRFDLPIIGIGNLSVGGSGKTPHTLWLAEQLQPLRTAVLSRGYGRNTHGFRWVFPQSAARDAGDEPLLIKLHRPEMPVAVCENRVEGVLRMLAEEPDLEVLLMDDVMQHRAIEPGFMIMLSSLRRPFYEDFVLPAGNLREWRTGKKRAHVIVITHCPPDLSKENAEKIRRRVKPGKNQLLLFSTKQTRIQLPENCEAVFALSGLADNDQFAESLRSHVDIVKHFRFPDHCKYTAKHAEDILNEMGNTDLPLVISEKDYVKLSGLHPELNKKLIPLQLNIAFLFDGERKIMEALEDYIEQYRDRFGDLRPDTLKN